MRSWLVVPVVAVLGGLLPSVARADVQVNVALTPEGQAFAAALGKTPEQLAADIKLKLDDAYQTANLPTFLRSFTDATAFSQRGIGVDYASLPRGMMIGIAGNVAAASDSVIDAQDRPTAGAAVNFALMAGGNLGAWDLPRWNLFLNGFYQRASTDQLAGNITSAGAHVQYRLVEPQDSTGATTKVVRWLGLDLTTGIEFTRWDLGARGLSHQFTIEGDAMDAAIDVDGFGTFDLSSTAVTIPVEATTGLRLALIASVYAGAGIDLTYGRSSVDGNLAGDVSTSGGGQKIGTMTIVGNGENTASPAAVRVLAGAQLNLWKLKIFVQGNLSATPAASVAFGLRLVL